MSFKSASLLLLLACDALGTNLLSNSTLPRNLTVGCSNALLADVDCSPVVASLKAGSYYPASTLNKTCTTSCSLALAAWEAGIVTSCADETWSGYDDEPMPLAIIPDLIRYEFNLSCIMDAERFCNNIAAQAAFAADPQSGDPVYGSSVASENNTAPSSVDVCDLCLIKNLQFQAGSPYYNGPDLASQSIYQSKIASCGVTGLPLVATSTLSFYSPPASSSPTPTTCGKALYAIQPGDDCYSISKAQNIGTGWLLMDNHLAASCVDFPTSGTLCLENACKVYTVAQNQTCSEISTSNNITVAQLLAWNPIINPGCYNMAHLNGSQLCISSPGKAYVPPSISGSLAPLTPTQAAAVPTDVASHTNTDCGQYYKVVAGDYCNLITVKFGISLADFTFLNPDINSNCTNLYAEESYCVAAVGDINTYSGRPGYTTATPVSVASFTPYTDIPTASASTTSSSAATTGIPLANGTRSDCNFYFNGSIFQGDVSFYASQCQLAADVYGVDATVFNSWNQGINVSDAGCSFDPNLRYCGKLFFGEAIPETLSSATYPIRDGASPNCTEYTDAYDGRTCKDILDTFDLTIAQFYRYNSAVGSDCGNLWTEYSYCVRTPDYVDELSPTTSGTGPSSTSTTAASSATVTAPTQSGQPPNCNKFYTVQSGDSCSSVADKYFITLAQFYAWNPAVSSDCSTGFWAGYAYCVGTTDTISQTRSSSAAPSTTSAAPTPSPMQANNAVSNCNAYAQTQSGDYCSLFADRNKITLSQLYAWNSVLGSDGSGCSNQFWAGYYYCVGVSSK